MARSEVHWNNSCHGSSNEGARPDVYGGKKWRPFPMHNNRPKSKYEIPSIHFKLRYGTRRERPCLQRISTNLHRNITNRYLISQTCSGLRWELYHHVLKYLFSRKFHGIKVRLHEKTLLTWNVWCREDHLNSNVLSLDIRVETCQLSGYLLKWLILVNC